MQINQHIKTFSDFSDYVTRRILPNEEKNGFPNPKETWNTWLASGGAEEIKGLFKKGFVIPYGPTLDMDGNPKDGLLYEMPLFGYVSGTFGGCMYHPQSGLTFYPFSGSMAFIEGVETAKRDEMKMEDYLQMPPVEVRDLFNKKPDQFSWRRWGLARFFHSLQLWMEHVDKPAPIKVQTALTRHLRGNWDGTILHVAMTGAIIAVAKLGLKIHFQVLPRTEVATKSALEANRNAFEAAGVQFIPVGDLDLDMVLKIKGYSVPNYLEMMEERLGQLV
ncbi:MAG TPA: hypothetical protein DCE41_00400 [Cytophagales bacterium]|nr:hypothetical protein [Cytophagales bacterium]HAA19074.1 hypothetical protein [Cytophagales bacterium]HAP64097.1 hypothetical protein [Cytophagales bacterium]